MKKSPVPLHRVEAHLPFSIIKGKMKKSTLAKQELGFGSLSSPKECFFT